MPRPQRSRWWRRLAIVLIAVGLVGAGRVAWVGYGPVAADDRLSAQVSFLNQAIDRGRDHDMQALFPEGRFFTRALTGSAMASAGSTSADHDWAALRAHRDVLDSPAMTSTFGSGMTPDHGIFQAGWALTVANDVARRTGDEADRADVRRRGMIVARALSGSSTGFLAGYPAQYWPCDSVVAAAALAEAASIVDEPSWRTTVASWRTRVLTHLDPDTGLLPHRVGPAGELVVGTRGSSQSIIQAFWPVIAAALAEPVDKATWARYVDQFVVNRAGLVGVREFPRGRRGAGDVDSGPLVLSVSASASAVTLAAARTVGDTALADSLDREAELVGLGYTWSGARRYALGQLPVGDAFLAWARSRPPAAPLDTGSARTWWPLLIAVAGAPGVIGIAGWRTRGRGARRTPAGDE